MGRGGKKKLFPTSHRLTRKGGWFLRRRRLARLANMQAKPTSINNDESINFRVFVEPLPIIMDSGCITEKEQYTQNQIKEEWTIDEKEIKQECIEEDNRSNVNDVEIIGWREWLHAENNYIAENNK